MKVVTFLTDGFETVEALAVVDLLRRAQIEVETVSITGNKSVKSAQNIEIAADKLFDEALYDDSDLLFLPGGGGHKNYFEHEKLLHLLKQHNQSGGRLAAICAAPSVLGRLGLLKGKKATCFPGFEESLEGAQVLTAPIKTVTDGTITTSRGMGTAVDLGLELIRILKGEEEAVQIGKSIQYL